VTSHYQFRVAGHLSERARSAFPDMVLMDAPSETIIYGEVIDEAHLHGLLALIQDLGLHVVALHEVRP